MEKSLSWWTRGIRWVLGPRETVPGRLLDLLAITLVLIMAFKLLVQPRLFAPPQTRAAPFTLSKLEGGSYRFTGGRGHVVFLDFWASWCGPCKVMMPLVEAFAREHPDVEVVAIDVAEPKEAVAAYARTHDLRNVVLDPHGTVSGGFGVIGFPTVVVIDPDGFVRAKWEGLNPAIGPAMENARDRFRRRAEPATTR